ncbi:prepilin peptidase [Vibrio aestuarianus]|uniref:prepilin peptidase n=2 Tax=Vibrio aestuarianus TaxID=28171 RepID=UPI003B97359E
MIFYISFALIAAMLCSCIVSFYQLCIFRYQLGFNWRRILFEPSYCESCGCKIKSVFLIPVFGFLISKGRCICCNKNIPVRYFVSEMIAFCMSMSVALLLVLEVLRNEYF